VWHVEGEGEIPPEREDHRVDGRLRNIVNTIGSAKRVKKEKKRKVKK